MIKYMKKLPNYTQICETKSKDTYKELAKTYKYIHNQFFQNTSK